MNTGASNSTPGGVPGGGVIVIWVDGWTGCFLSDELYETVLVSIT